MIKLEVTIPDELIEEIIGIVHKEGYTLLYEAFPAGVLKPHIFLSLQEAEALIILAIIEMKKAWLRYPHNDDQDPLYDEGHEEKYDDIQMGIYEKTIYYVQSAFKKGSFDHLF